MNSFTVKKKEKIKNLLPWGIGLTFLAGLIIFFILGKSNGQPDRAIYSASVLSAVENTFDFNAISMKNGKVSHRFELKNDGEEPVFIEKAYTSCMCTTASIIDVFGKNQGTFGMLGHGSPSKADVEVRPGDLIFIEVVFDPAAHGPSGTGKVKRLVYLETNPKTNPKIQLAFNAEVTN